MSQKYEKLKTLLKELFQLDQPDLDFGIYRIMHAKSAEVTQFLDQDLLPQVRAAFAQYQPADKAALEKELGKLIAGVEAAGMDPEQSPRVKALGQKLAEEAVDLGALESEVYDHLFSFFRRYYSEGDVDEQTDGLLMHSENFQALWLLQRRLGRQVSAAYLDPPYNTDAAPISYKNGYRRSSWTALMESRLENVRTLLSPGGVLCTTIDDYQYRELGYLIEEVFGQENLAGIIAIRSNPSGRPIPSGLAQAHEYAIFAKASPQAELGKLPRTEKQTRRYRESDTDGSYMWELFRKRGSGSERADRRTLYYPVYTNGTTVRVPRMRWNDAARTWDVQEEPVSGEVAIWPVQRARSKT